MDYSDDICAYEFTTGQVEVMQAFYYYERLENFRSEISLGLSVPSDPIDIEAGMSQIFKLSTTKCSVVCRTKATSGDADLFIRLESAPVFNANADICVSEGNDSNEECTISRGAAPGVYAAICGDRPGNNKCASIDVYIGVQGFDDVNGVTVTCS